MLTPSQSPVSLSEAMPEAVRGALAALDSLSPRLLSSPRAAVLTLPPAPLSSLLSSVGHTLGDVARPVIMFVSAYANEGAGTIAFESALGVSKAGKRVLFLDTSPLNRSVMAHSPGSSANSGVALSPLSLDAFLAGNQFEQSPFWLVEGTTLCCASLPEGSGIVHGRAVLLALFHKLRHMFDVVVVHAESALATGAVAAYASLSDGVVMVVEAERLREPVAQEMQRHIVSNGGRVVGAILNKRRFYIPGFLYNLLYRSRR